ncbi:MAG: cell division protein FtsZ [Ignavibacteria bacterium]|nr:cell division protein FtsZ [Ignavibacteria bacterium]
MSIQLLPNEGSGAKIKVVGVGGGGGNIVNSMINKGIEGVEFIAVNTDSQALEISNADIKIQIGKNITKGLGTGMKYDIGEKAAEETREEITKALAGSDMVFITAGMGGGTGTGASPIVAHIAKSLDALVVSIVTKPFHFEAKPRMRLAEDGIDKLRKNVDSLIVIPNQRILELMPRESTKEQAFAMANRVLYNATKGISQIITKTGEINVDFADVRTVMRNSGDAIMGTGIARGEGRAMKAVMEALSNPVLDDVILKGARNVLINICSSGQILMSEIDEINEHVSSETGDKANYIFGLVDDKELEDEVMVTVIATGFNRPEEEIMETKTDIQRKIIDDELLHAGKITSLPDSVSGLKELDIPAYKRRVLDVKINNDLSEDKEAKKADKLKNIGFDDLGIDKDVQPPAFLRRSLD